MPSQSILQNINLLFEGFVFFFKFSDSSSLFTVSLVQMQDFLPPEAKLRFPPLCFIFHLLEFWPASFVTCRSPPLVQPGVGVNVVVVSPYFDFFVIVICGINLL